MRIYKLLLILQLVQTMHASQTHEKIVARMGMTVKMWKSDDFRKFMKVRLHNSFPRCNALCSRDVVTWNLRPLPLFSKEQQRVSLFRCTFYRFALYNVFRKSCTENDGILRVRKRWFQESVFIPRRKSCFDAKDFRLEIATMTGWHINIKRFYNHYYICDDIKTL